MKLLKRLTTMPKRRPTAVSSPLMEAGCSFFRPSEVRICLEVHFPFIEKSFSAFAHVFGGARKAKQCRFQEQAFFLRHLDARSMASMVYFTASGALADDFLAMASAAGSSSAGS